MRATLAVVGLLAVACSAPPQEESRGFGFTSLPLRTMADTDGDGLPDRRLASTSVFVDTDADGLPDTRIEAESQTDLDRARRTVQTACLAVQNAADRDALEHALRQFDQAVTGLRDALTK